jgi:hypothetical protein
MDPIHTRLTAIENHLADNDTVDAYSWSQLRRRNNWYGVRINTTEVPQLFLELIEDQHTEVDYIQSRHPVSIRLEVNPQAALEWEYEELLR